MRIRRQAAAVVSTITLCTLIQMSPGHAELMKVVNIADGDTLNVRSGPNASSPDIGDLQEGSLVHVEGYNFQGTWAQIRYRGQIAWVSTRYLDAITRADGSSTSVGPHQVTGIKAGDPDGGLVARNGPGVGHERLGVLPNGITIHVVQISDDGKWAQIPFGSQMAWVSRRYLNSVADGGTSAGTSQHPTGTPQPMPAGDPMAAPDGLPLPAIFSVSGVAADDSLNIRNAPQVSGQVIAQAQNGIALAVLGMATAHWAKVQVGQTIGFAHADYLSRGGGTTNMTGFQLGTECIGTEPFWRMTFDTDNMVRMTMMGEAAQAAPLRATTFSATPTGYPYSFNAAPYSGEVNMGLCSDGMSDNIYPMSITLSVPNAPGAPGAPMVVNGCCRLQ